MAHSALPSDTELKTYLLSFDLFEQLGRPQEGEEYITFHLQRFRKTLDYLPVLAGEVQVLELGASPYFMTFLMQKYFGYKVSTANFFADYRTPAGGTETARICSRVYQEDHEYTYPLFNLETDPFPFADQSFDIILCCEIIEHLIMDPSFMLAEIHRLLKPGGYLLLTTPNIASLKNVLTLLQGRNIQHSYSGYGVYGRHNREFTARELAELIRLHHFEVQVTVDDVYPSPAWLRWLTALSPWRGYRDNLFALCRALPGNHYPQYPQWLYSHLWGHASNINRLSKAAITMGQGEEIQLGEGWYPLENEPPHFRWTGTQAMVRLRVPPGANGFCLEANSGGRETTFQLWQESHLLGTFTLVGRRWIEFFLPASLTQPRPGEEPILCFRLVTLNPFRPSEVDPQSSDQRLLGLVVYRLQLRGPNPCTVGD